MTCCLAMSRPEATVATMLHHIKHRSRTCRADPNPWQEAATTDPSETLTALTTPAYMSPLGLHTATTSTVMRPLARSGPNRLTSTVLAPRYARAAATQRLARIIHVSNIAITAASSTAAEDKVAPKTTTLRFTNRGLKAFLSKEL